MRTNPDRDYRTTLQEQSDRARQQTDLLFHLIEPKVIYDRPIRERHRMIFYLGHLEAFEWNMVCQGTFGMDSFHPEFDRLFAFGIDPTDGQLPDDQPGDWPSVQETQQYVARVREAVDRCLRSAPFDQDAGSSRSSLIFHVAIEHRLMHAETLAYMLHSLPFSSKIGQHDERIHGGLAPARRSVDIPPGRATLGLVPTPDTPFGWDNEFSPVVLPVPAFAIDVYNVTNSQFLEFVTAGGYEERSLWDEAAWHWIRHEGVRYPKFWNEQQGRWTYRAMFADIPLPAMWPVYVSHAEATAYARWKGRSLPTEAQFHRAAFGTPEGPERAFPWGRTLPGPEHGNFNFRRWNPVPVGSHRGGDSAFGVADLVGNGWEWTSTPFAPLPGFKPFSFYPGYSANFFDGRHYVLKGGSSRTAAGLLRRSFRNWFQPHYPNIYATFRCVDN